MDPDAIEPKSHDELERLYNKFARFYAIEGWVVGWLARTRRLRRGLMSRATGRVLDVACGTGENFRYFRQADAVTAVDLSPAMLDKARRRARKLGLGVYLRQMKAEELEFEDDSFDTVTSALSTCTFPDPVAALREMARVATPGAKLLLLEHGKSTTGWMGRWQDRRAAKHYQSMGCRWNQEPTGLVEGAGLSVHRTETAFFGMFTALEVSA